MFQCKIKTAYTNTTFSSVHDRHLFSVHIQVYFGTFHKRMGVSAQNHVDIVCSGNQMFIHLNTQMRQAYDQITAYLDHSLLPLSTR